MRGAGAPGSIARNRSARWRYSGTRRAAAAAWAAASETASSALPPSRLFCGVPSSSISRASSACWSAASKPDQRRRDHLAHVAPRPPARRGRRSAPSPCRAARGLRPRRCWRPRGRSPGPSAPPARVHLGLDRRIAAAVEHFAGQDAFDARQAVGPPESTLTTGVIVERCRGTATTTCGQSPGPRVEHLAAERSHPLAAALVG